MNAANVFQYQKIRDLNNQRECCLYFEKAGENGANFHSIVLEGDPNIDGKYSAKIIKNDLKSENDAKSITAIHSFDFDNRTVICQMMTMEKVVDNKSKASYFWVEWDVENNKEINFIMKCKTPYESPNC